MEDEFYHKNIFGEVVDAAPAILEEEEKLPLDKKGMEFNIFILTDAFGVRNKREAWILYQQALAAGVAGEEVFYKLVWQVRSMLLAQRSVSAEAAGLNPFVYKKAMQFLTKWKSGELETVSHALISCYHEARRGNGEIETLVEKTLLGL